MGERALARSRPQPPPAARRGAAVLTVAVALALAAAAVGLRQTRPPPSGIEGQKVTPLRLARLTLEPQAEVAQIEIGAGYGRPSLVHFWGPSCGPCVDEAPAIAALARGAGAYSVWTITAEDAEDVRAMLRRLGLDFPVLHDAAGAAHRAFGVSAIPHSFVLDGEGVVLRQFVGPASADTLREALNDAASSAR
jgi:thiol-disulfide isomerase/thioredoxin